ncbi:acyltransferase [Thalassotalea ganghwensis]
MIYSLVNYIIRKVKKSPEYQLDKQLNSYVILSLALERLVTLTRGTLFQLVRFKKPTCLFLGKRTRIKFSQSLKLAGTTTIGANVTIECLGRNGVELGENVNIPDNCFIRCTGVISNLGLGIKIGNNTGLGHNNFLNGQGGICIGNDVIIGPDVKILSENHNYSDPNQPIRLQGVSRQGIVIEANVWIGANVTILDGVRIGKGSVIGAGSVVSKSIPENSIAVGVPCRVIKKRSTNNE